MNENTILKEELNTFKKLREANDNLTKSSIERNTAEIMDDVIDDSLNLEDDYVKDFYWHQKRNRLNRTGPSSSADTSVYSNKCDLCPSSFKTMELLRTHKREHKGIPGFKCEKCSVSTTTKDQLKKHIEIKHRAKSIICRFWKQSRCNKQDNCAYLHPKKPQPCRFQFDCNFWPNCKFSHDENIMYSFQMNRHAPRGPYQQPTRITKPCHFQNNCWRSQCKFRHFEANNQTPFLEKRRNFDPLDPSEFPPLVNTPVWRPW